MTLSHLLFWQLLRLPYTHYFLPRICVRQHIPVIHDNPKPLRLKLIDGHTGLASHLVAISTP